ncbi:MAG: hypothetical protein AB7E66_01835 [Parvibaculaceae bacterium]
MALLAFLLAATGPFGSPTAAPTADPLATAAIRPLEVPHELRIERTGEGREGLELAARLSVTGNLITRPVGWTVKRALASDAAGGETIFTQESPVTDLKLEPGDYLVEASYGAVRVAHSVRVEPGRFVGLTLILNVGGIRALSTLDTIGMPVGVVARHKVLALSGPLAGREIAASAGQGELLRVAAGSYRIESRFLPGNTVSETSVTVKPGVLTSVEIAHLAGVARIDISAATRDTPWVVRTADGRDVSSGQGIRPNLILAPGDYAIEADIAGSRRKASFSVVAGKTTRVVVAE